VIYYGNPIHSIYLETGALIGAMCGVAICVGAVVLRWVRPQKITVLLKPELLEKRINSDVAKRE
jgi:hypothetical protein